MYQAKNKEDQVLAEEKALDQSHELEMLTVRNLFVLNQKVRDQPALVPTVPT